MPLPGECDRMLIAEHLCKISNAPKITPDTGWLTPKRMTYFDISLGRIYSSLQKEPLFHCFLPGYVRQCFKDIKLPVGNVINTSINPNERESFFFVWFPSRLKIVLSSFFRFRERHSEEYCAMYDICGARSDGKVLNCPYGSASVKV